MRRPLRPRRPGAESRGGSVPARRVQGFSMLEVLVAFVILALVGTALFRLFSGALTNASAADDYSRALLVAESVLEETAGTPPLRDGTRSGNADDGRIEWTTRVAPYLAPVGNADAATGTETMNVQLWRVVADVRFPGPDGKPRTLTLATVRMATKDLK